jgi:uncharacterized membrane protein
MDRGRTMNIIIEIIVGLFFIGVTVLWAAGIWLTTKDAQALWRKRTENNDKQT